MNVEYLEEKENIIILDKILMIIEMYYLYSNILNKKKNRNINNSIDDECFIYFFLNICNEYNINPYKVIAIMLEKKSFKVHIPNDHSTLSKIFQIVKKESKKNKKEINNFIDENAIEEYIKYLISIDSKSIILKFIESMYNQIVKRLEINKKVNCYHEVSEKISLIANNQEPNENILVFLHYINFFLDKKIKIPIPQNYNIQEIAKNIFNKQNSKDIEIIINKIEINRQKIANQFILNILEKQSVDIKKVELSKKIIDTYISLSDSLPFTASSWFQNKLNLNFYEILALMKKYNEKINEWNFHEFTTKPLYILQRLLNCEKNEISMYDKLICNIFNIYFFKKEPEYDIDVSKLKLELVKVYIDDKNKNVEEYIAFIKNGIKSLKYFYFFLSVFLFLLFFLILLLKKISHNKKWNINLSYFLCFLLLIYVMYKTLKNLLNSYNTGRNQLFYE